MKELSIEEKAKAYDGLIERLKDLKFAYRFSPLSDTIEDMFPELKESEDDDEIRKDILNYIKHNYDGQHISISRYDSWIAWLEKQGEQKPAVIIPKFRIGDYVKNTNYKREPIYEIVYMDKECYVCEYRGKEKMGDKSVMHFSFDNPYLRLVQKPVDKVEPKFNVGDWAVSIVNGNIYHVINIEGSLYIMEHEDERCTFPWKKTDDILRAWNIQDAKDGDVLLSPPTPAGDKECPFIFKEIDENGVVRCHAALIQSKSLKISDGITNVMGYANAGYHIPATKEQRDLLFQKMKEAGYEWDADKKELEKIEQKPIWSENELKILNEIIEDYEKANKSFSGYQARINWLKSLKPQNRWKPSERQKEALLWCVVHLGGADKQTLGELLEELNKL